MTDVLIGLCLFGVLLGMVPTLTTFAQFLAVGLHGIWNHYPKCRDFTPRVAFVLPAWNEADVLGASIDSLMSIDYPAGQWRIYVVDDASTNHTPEVMRRKMAQYPGSVFHLRREKGGQGKALAAGLYLVPPDRRLIIPRGDTPELVPTLHRACKERRIEALLPTVDAELAPVAAARGSFDAIGVALPISPVECLRICRDKQLLIETMQGKVAVPGNELLTESVARRVDSFPRFVKPRLGAGSRGAARIDSRADLDKQPKDGSVLLQEYLPGEEYSVDVYARRDGRVIAAVPRDRMKIDSGVAVASRTVHVPDVIQSAIRTAETIGVRGVANVQFKRAADGVLKLLEVNPRFPGTLPLTAAAGIDMPRLMVDELMGRPVPDELMPFKELMVVRYWTERYFEAREWEALCRQR